MAPGERVYTGSRVRKLGAKAGMRAWLVGIDDSTFADELRADGVEVVIRGAEDDERDAINDGNTRPQIVFLGVHCLEDLGLLELYKNSIPRDGVIWLVRPKGRDTPVPERAAMEAGLEAGLVDVKVVSFSDTHSALKYVFRLRDR
ncbi:MAG: hypothetical protein ABR573_02140 [Candidatus Dormibacteria bacterium]